MTRHRTDEAAVREAAAALLAYHDHDGGMYRGKTPDDVISEHTDDPHRWATLMRWALREAIKVDPTVGRYTSRTEAERARYREGKV